MAQLTPDDILKLSEPIEKVYIDVVNALLINMAKHFNSGYSLSTQDWEIKKLAELGQLNKESIEIISDMTGQTPEMVKVALENSVFKATADLEPELKKAVKDGAIQAAAADNVLASENIQEVLSAYNAQALQKTNLVNTVMLESTLSQFRKIVTNTVNIERQLNATQQILNTATGQVLTGTESRTQALRAALKQISEQGITGFYDKAGRSWSPEAYVNMDIRTTVHNTSIEATKIRAQDYGVSTFQVSSHSGARPLCYPYQGKFYSWDNSSGTFTDGEGVRHSYQPISSTSYGQAAGLFGINCGHYPITMVPGYSIPREQPIEDKELNDKIYAESQKQRYLEREVRAAKREAAMYNAAGDTEAFEKAAVKVKQKQADYNTFCKETGRTKRLDRTQVFEYNRSVSSKATAAAKRATEKENYINNIKPTLPKNNAPLPDAILQTGFDVDITTKAGYELHSVVPSETALTDVRIIAGYGVKDSFRNANKFAQEFGNEAYKWQKIGGLIKTDNFVYDVHW